MEKILSEDYCTYEISRLLEEKGFHAPDLHGLDSSQGHLWVKVTHQMAIKWLREEKNLFIDISFINHYTKDEILHTGWCFAVFHLDNFDAPYYKDIEYSTYEQAVEAALKYSLENLI